MAIIYQLPPPERGKNPLKNKVFLGGVRGPGGRGG